MDLTLGMEFDRQGPDVMWKLLSSKFRHYVILSA